MKKKSINQNYIPHNEFIHRETRRTEEDWDNVMMNLSSLVGKACDKWLEKRGFKPTPFIEQTISMNNKPKRPNTSGEAS